MDIVYIMPPFIYPLNCSGPISCLLFCYFPYFKEHVLSCWMGVEEGDKFPLPFPQIQGGLETCMQSEYSTAQFIFALLFAYSSSVPFHKLRGGDISEERSQFLLAFIVSLMTSTHSSVSGRGLRTSKYPAVLAATNAVALMVVGSREFRNGGAGGGDLCNQAFADYDDEGDRDDGSQ